SSIVNTCNTEEDDPSEDNPFRSVSLGGMGDQPDMTNNYMDYGELACINSFTEGQKDRMIWALTWLRSSLLASQGCAEPCTSPVNISFECSSRSILSGETVHFTNHTTGAGEYEWQINGKQISG